MKNVLFLVKKSDKPLKSQRNLLNKWFQDSIKSYILEQVAFPFFSKYLNCKTSQELKHFMSQIEVGKNKPKYMEMIEQYFYYVNQFNLREAFIQKLNSIIKDPTDITEQKNYHTYNCQKIVRKQFVCLLILRFFEYYHLHEFMSFYDLWNFCFPEAVQKKKKLSKYDTKIQKKQKCQSESSTKSGSSPTLPIQQINNNISFSSPDSSHIKNEQPSSDLNSLIANNLHQNQLQLQDKIKQQKEYENTSFQQQQISSKIVEEDDDEEEEYINLSHQLSYQQELICKKEEEPSQSQNICSEINLEPKRNQHKYLCIQQDPSLIYYQIQYQYYLPAQQIPNQFNASQCKIEIKTEDLNQPIFQLN
ncbi:hypothetical protein TTHERM_00607290 (macronuclear) [Tetrahymena thermophila SB210]|uniref:Uncharacterized protein n=1 Tax=Tetrahymena thermophila (strain SB210) TaxID=312017 RepID=Q22YG2_TETTS|nr:hypothetical protein TTHERM_00607290 [Tetrahymena thermophila SB210]EAR90323.2 hypothetical protein TTHERM_00607290 [Tetrahymena thermophila SB210]|eukprot:XP_001010568.2 hypothetical protein TTHERM_00607290 [Tetrahymena thermophila SB210]